MLLAGRCPMGLPASSRFRKSHCRRWRPWPWPGVWCRRGGPLLRMRSWRPAGRLVRTKNAICGKGSPRSVSASRMPPAATASELSGSSSGAPPDSRRTTPATVRPMGSTWARSLPARVNTRQQTAESSWTFEFSVWSQGGRSLHGAGLRPRGATRARWRSLGLTSGLQDRAARPDFNGGNAPGIQHNEPITVSATKNPSLFRQRRNDVVDDFVLTDRVGLLVGDIQLVAACQPDPQHNSCHAHAD